MKKGYLAGIAIQKDANKEPGCLWKMKIKTVKGFGPKLGTLMQKLLYIPNKA